jgi:negative regulator of replication initiation
MNVTAYKNVDVEVECDIDSDAIIAEFSQRVGESSADYFRRAIQAIDCITRILGEVKEEVIAAVPAQGKEIVAKRLLDQSKRWEVK